MKTPYKHQQAFINRDKDRDLLVYDGGTGKTFCGCLWLSSNKRKHIQALVVCPKAVIGKWKRDLKEDCTNTNVEVCSRDEIKKIDLNKYGAIILDEAQDFASAIFDKSRSQRTTVLYNYVKAHPEAHMLLLTATPVRSTPWNIHTLAVYLGIYWDHKKFREEFFKLTDLYGRLHYEKRKDWRVKIRPYIESVADIVLMQDLLDVPISEEEVINIPWTDKQEGALQYEAQYMEPSAEWHARHRAENGKEKFKVLQGILDKYQKIIVVCYYKQQIKDYADYIGEEREVFILTGDVKDQDKVITDAQASTNCVWLLQASMGAGFDADTFAVMVFASMSFKYIDHAQAKFRIRRIHNLHKNKFIYLLNGKCDNAVYEQIIAGRNFDPIEYLAGTSKEAREARSQSINQSASVDEEAPF